MKNHPKSPKTPQNAPEGQGNSNPPSDPTSTPSANLGPAEGLAAQNASAPTAESALEDQITSLTNDLQRTRADFENFRKQTDLQRTNAEKSARRAVVYKFLPLLDDFSRALTSYPELAPLAKSLAKTQQDLGLTPIEASPDTEFDPDLHDAVMVEGDGDHELIAEVLRPGYYYEGEVLRPAMVKVRKANS